MRLFITTAVAALAFAGAASAQDAKPAKASAARSQYISVAGGVIGKSDYDYDFTGGSVTADLDAGAQGVVAWGATVGANWRAELAVGYRNQKLDSTVRIPPYTYTLGGDKAQTVTLDINAYYDFPVSGPVKPYLGAGIGVASVKIDDGLLDDRGDALSLQAIAGASWAVSPTVSLFAEGRFQRVGPVKVKVSNGFSETKSDFDLSSAGGLVGVRFGF
ncbi:outer membrane protein [Caulobacter hibisci]|uniref:Outer membrane beta-barrel protein n=1 Tax=Caulobacter hibisci TaxID=2035993 RepID=A0ABS0T1V1_9CAUL|nr:outer membrane beta-barrel protein [Caulobacter hibisci]MBI1685862.1 outer membrane beta-barrel protein [Caulobacter hibisci]